MNGLVKNSVIYFLIEKTQQIHIEFYASWFLNDVTNAKYFLMKSNNFSCGIIVAVNRTELIKGSER